MEHTILFDVDGILLLNKNIQDYIKHRSICFLRNYKKFNKKYPLASLSCNASSKLNEIGYKQFGHTSLIVEDSKDCVKDYNDYVFDENTMLYIKNTLTVTDNIHLDKIRLILNKNKNIDIGLCTNTPLRYCEAVIYPGETNTFKENLLNNAFTSDKGLIKPKLNFYNNVNMSLYNSHVHFIDDSILNLNGVESLPNWYPVLIDKNTEVNLYHYLNVLSSSIG